MLPRAVIVAFLLSPLAFAGPVTLTPATSAPPDPLDQWQWSLQTSSLWSIGSNASPLNYHLLPQMLDLKSPAHLRLDPGPGQIVVRSRVTIEFAPVVNGPESYFAGVLFSPSVEWWNDARSWALFLSAGGGFGWMDSQGYHVPGGQGQDFNLSWFIQSGLTHRLSDHLSASLGVMYQHISNGGMDAVNPGIDSLGPLFSLSWSF